jgi:hypothetical protein
MKYFQCIAATAFLTLTLSSAIAAPPEAMAPMTMPMGMSDHSAHMHAMIGKAESARTQAERNKLMAENMAMMKAHMAEISAMKDEKPMTMPMVMDAAHMEKMKKRMAMMHQMMESLMIQQQLMMKFTK